MPDDLRTRIAALHQAHRWGVFRCDDGYARTCCRCQWRELPDGPTHAEHVADAVIRELNLLKEDGECSYCHAQLPGCRYICDWKNDE